MLQKADRICPKKATLFNTIINDMYRTFFSKELLESVLSFYNKNKCLQKVLAIIQINEYNVYEKISLKQKESIWI